MTENQAETTVCALQSETASLRVTLPLLGVSVGEVPAGAHRDLQAGGDAVVGQAELHLARRADAVEEAAFCADAAVAALSRSNAHKQCMSGKRG